MGSLFVLFVAAHLLIDLGIPSLPGAFRFDPDTSVMGVRIPARQAPDLQPSSALPRETGPTLLRVARMPGDPKPGAATPVPIAFPRRHDPARDRSPENSTDDH